MSRTFLASLLCVGLSALFANPASACGGFFCDNSQPVNQNAERIIFSDNGDGTVTAVIQIQYQGPAERFAWVLPVPGTPEIGISSNLAFTRLQAASNPSYQMTTTVEGECDEPAFDSRAPSPGGSFDAGASADGSGGGVNVVDSGTVGPFDYVTIALDPETPDPGDVAVEFLRDGGYDVDELGRERLGPYLAGGMNLIAFRLTKNATAGSIRPIVMTYESDRPMIPIRPTAVAATDDMGVMVWVLGESRAIPSNYRHLVLNEALINWFSPGGTYNDVVTAAADEAGGQGFVTEQAGRTADLDLRVYNEFEALEREGFGTEINQVIQVINRYVTYDGLRDAVASALVLPEGLALDDFLSCPGCFERELADEDGEIADFEIDSLYDAVDELVLTPLRMTQALLERRPYITRLYTTMSADEMTMDPEFDFNPDLADFSNQHVAERTIHCGPGRTRGNAPWTTVLPNGDEVRGENRSWPYSVSTSLLPATLRIEQMGTSGEPEIIEDNSPMIATQVSRDSAAFRPSPIEGSGLAGGGCSVGGTQGAGASLLALLALGFIRRRR